MVDKKFKTLDEQIEILKSKHMVINNEEYAKGVLLRENYFFLNGYRSLFMVSSDDRVFKEGTRFEELYSLFLFDRSFRNIIFKYLLIIENNVKSIVSYQLSKKYGYRERDYLKPKNFTNRSDKRKQVNDLVKKMQRQVKINSAQHTATQHYLYNYGYIPLWILVKVLSFGIVSEMYSILKPDDQREISNIYQVEVDTLLSYLPLLANYRNLCAHEDILFDHRSQKVIADTIYHDKLNIPKDQNEYICGKSDLFALLIIMKQMLEKEKFNKMILEIDNVIQTLAYHITTIDVSEVLKKMGFPYNWKDLKSMEGEETYEQ